MEEMNLGRSAMAGLQDREMERLFDLLAAGKLCNAREIASLLKVELARQTDPTPEKGRCEVLFRMARSNH
jgi:hypothetical protein